MTFPWERAGRAYYSENNPYAAQWLRNLIDAGCIAFGDVDERSIVDVAMDDIRGYTQCHFFAGLGGWPYALRAAGWDDRRPVWTGSCPCQPFSNAGKRKGFEDERHLWPEWFRLIRQCIPATIFGEQVASAIKHGWLDTVFADLESENYACGAAVLPACSVGAPHKRDRLWFVANAKSERCGEARAGSGQSAQRFGDSGKPGQLASRVLGHALRARLQERRMAWPAELGQATERTGAPISSVGHASGEQVGISGFAWQSRNTHWSNVEWLPCRDGKARPVESGTFPLAHGVSGRVVIRRSAIEGKSEIEEEHWYSRVGALSGIGNAIVPQVAVEFIAAFLDTYLKHAFPWEHP